MKLPKTCLLVLLLSALLLASCGSAAVKPTPTTTASPASSYAFVRQGQLWLSIKASPPAQVTHFDYRRFGIAANIFWRQPLWSPGDGFIAFLVRALPTGLGGGGACGGLNYAWEGALYVLNTRTLRLTRVALPASKEYPADTNALAGYWEHLFWEDATHLLAWTSLTLATQAPGSDFSQADKTGGLYRYDLGMKTLTEVIPATSLSPSGAWTASAITQWFPLRYSRDQLFYQVIENDPHQSNTIKFVIYRHSTLHPALPTTKVLEIGSEPLPHVGPNVPPCPPFTNPGWDISPDGKRLVAQMLLTDTAGHVSSSVRVLNVTDGSLVTLFGQLSSQVFTRDLALTWGPDNRSVLLSSWSSQAGPYSTTLLHPAQTQAYPPDTSGHVVWRSDSAAFALFQLQQFALGPNTPANVYVFAPGQPDRRVLVANAFNFAWG